MGDSFEGVRWQKRKNRGKYGKANTFHTLRGPTRLWNTSLMNADLYRDAELSHVGVVRRKIRGDSRK